MRLHSVEVIDNTSVVLPHPFKEMFQIDKKDLLSNVRPVIYKDESGELFQLYGEELKNFKKGPIKVVVLEGITREEQFKLCSILHNKHQKLINNQSLKTFKLLYGDCLEHLKTISDNSIDSVVTDPPYHLDSIVKRFGKSGSATAKDRDGLFQRYSKGFMGKDWDGGDIAFRTEVWRQCLRVLKPGGYLLSFSAAKNYHRMAMAIEDSGFEIRDQIMWIYGSGFPKNHNVGKAVDKIHGIKRNVIGNKPYKSGKLGSEGLSGGDFRTINRIQLKDMVGNSEWEGWGTALKPAHEPIVVARKPLSEKSIARNVLQWGTGAINIDACRIPLEEQTNPMVLNGDQGRWPANLIFNNPPEENWSKYFYCPKASKKEKEFGTDILPEMSFSRVNDGGLKNDPRWADMLRKNIHPTVKPLKLMDHLVRMVTPKGGTTLDPFMGSGTTGISAVRNGFRFIGIEREQDYFELANARMECFYKESV